MHELAKKAALAGIVLAAAFALSACEDGAGPFAKRASGGEDGAAPSTSTTIVERDVEAPEVFQLSSEGLWDGRPSLGGVWVASPGVRDPERVIIRNTSNGKFVIGALFRRERDNPGPSLQVSSDAASALGMLAGAPAKLSVTALRREEAAPEPAAVRDAAAAIAPDAAISTAPLEPAAPGPATPGPAVVAPGAAPAPEAAPAKPAAAKPGKTYVQIGIFSVESNATGTAKRLKAAGLDAAVKKSSANGKDYWRVIVGPAASAADHNAALAKAKALGFSDAYPVSG